MTEPEPEMFLLVCEDELVHPDVFVADHPDTSPVTLFRLTTHEEVEVRRTLAARHDLPRKAFERLARDPDPSVVDVVLRNPARPTT